VHATLDDFETCTLLTPTFMKDTKRVDPPCVPISEWLLD